MQVNIEGCWSITNPRFISAYHDMFARCQTRGLIDSHNPHHKGACQAIGQPLVQYGCDLFQERWNKHRVRVRHDTGPARSPQTRAAEAPHPGPMHRLSPSVISDYESAAQRPLRRMPDWLAERDPLHGDAVRQAHRAQAVMAVLGSVRRGHCDVMHSQGERYVIPALCVYQLVYLSFT